MRIGATQSFTAYDGTRLVFHVRGEGDPPAVLPGGPVRASPCLGDLGVRAAHRRLILLDLRGTGDSAVPEDPGTGRDRRLRPRVPSLLPRPPGRRRRGRRGTRPFRCPARVLVPDDPRSFSRRVTAFPGPD